MLDRPRGLLIPDLSKVRVLIVGDVILDRYWFGDAERISREAPLPVVKIHRTEERLGGAANAAFNVVSLGGKATLFGLIGRDEAGNRLEELLQEQGVDCQLVRVENVSTIVKLRVMSQNQQLSRMDFETNFDLQSSCRLLDLFQSQLKTADVVILSDYGQGTLQCAEALIDLAKAAHVPVLVDPRNKDFSVYRGATLIKPNKQEFQAAEWGLTHSAMGESSFAEKASTVLRSCDIPWLLLTDGRKGMTLYHVDQSERHIPGIRRDVFDVTGAGDTVIGVLAVMMAAGLDVIEAAQLANVAASLVVGKLGTAAVTHEELTYAMHGEDTAILVEDQLLEIIRQARLRGEKIVMTNGCFDILHAGHIHYLEQAKQCGDRLIVAINDDAAIKRLKGENRPINDLTKRLSVLAGLKSVDWVVSFSEDTAERLINLVAPDVYVKGGDYKNKFLPEAQGVLDRGGEVVLIDLVPNCSTTAVIERIHTQE